MRRFLFDVSGAVDWISLAVVDLEEEMIEILQARHKNFQELKAKDGALCELVFTDFCCRYYAANIDLLDGHRWEEEEVDPIDVSKGALFALEAMEEERVEGTELVMFDHGIVWRAYPREVYHVTLETEDLPYKTLFADPAEQRRTD